MLAELRPAPVFGKASPRIAPPLPVRSRIDELREIAATIGYPLFPWQEIAGRYITALGQNDRRLYREIAVIVARRNGKTTILIPLIILALREGRRIMHVAQNRELPREIHREVVNLMIAHYPGDLPGRGGYRFGAGQEEIRSQKGGVYKIVAAGRGGARGISNDLVIIDELREIIDNELIAAAKPTINASPNGQIVYVSNAGHDDSVTLNQLRARSGEDESLAYLEWSAAPEYKADDIEGWCEANPSLGHIEPLMESLAADYTSHKLAGTLSIFETENLCRWVRSMRAHLVEEAHWAACHVEDAGSPRRPFMGVSMDPDTQRASAVIAWMLPGDARRVALRLVLEAVGDQGSPIDVDDFGHRLQDIARKNGVREWVYDPKTDRELAKYAKVVHPVSGDEFANASAMMANLVQLGSLLWDTASEVTDDLSWTIRKEHEATGQFQAIRADEARPITAVMAAIRAVWRASGPSASTGARIW